MSHLTFGWNEFRKALYFSLVFSAPAGAITGGGNNEMTNSVRSHKKRGRTSGREITKTKSKNLWEKC